MKKETESGNERISGVDEGTMEEIVSDFLDDDFNESSFSHKGRFDFNRKVYIFFNFEVCRITKFY